MFATTSGPAAVDPGCGAGRQGALTPVDQCRDAAKRIRFTCPEWPNQISRRRGKGLACGRPPAFDGEEYMRRNLVEGHFIRFKQFVTRRFVMPNLPIIVPARSSSLASFSTAGDTCKTRASPEIWGSEDRGSGRRTIW